MYKSSQVLFKHSIQDLSLAVCLRVISGAKPEFSVGKAEQLVPKTANENRVTTNDDTSRESVEFAHSVNEQRSNFMGTVRRMQSTEVGLLGKSVNDN